MPETQTIKNHDEQMRDALRTALYKAINNLRDPQADTRTIASQVKQTADLVLIELEEAPQ
jgi:ribosomal protein S5